LNFHQDEQGRRNQRRSVFGDFEEAPLVDPFSDLPLGIEVVIYVVSLPINLRVIQNIRILEGAKRNDVHGLSGMEGRGRLRLAVTRAGCHDDKYKRQIG